VPRNLPTLLKTASISILLAAVVYAPWAYGCTRPLTEVGLIFLLGMAVLLWIAHLIVQRRLPRVGWLPTLLSAGILVVGWTSAIWGRVMENAFDNDWDPTGLPLWLQGLGSVESSDSLPAMVLTSALLAAFLLAIEIWNDPLWSRRLLLTIALTGVSIAAFGLLQKIVGGPLMLASADRTTLLSFATYRYWGNAGAFLNLVWPIVAALAVLAIARNTHPVIAGFWFMATVVSVAACFINVSKAGNALSAFGLVLFLCATAFTLRQRLLRRARRMPLVESFLIAAALLVTLIAAFFLIPWERWRVLEQMGLSAETNPRTAAYLRLLQMIPDAGPTGFGPGTFDSSYYSYVSDSDLIMRGGAWWVAHQDYIQTIVEWGWVGSAFWLILLASGMVLLLAHGARSKSRPSISDETAEPTSIMLFLAQYGIDSSRLSPQRVKENLVLLAAFIACLSTALHAAVDFPMQIPSLQLYFLLWIALGWSCALDRTKRPAGDHDD
jgi:hypothetical protein